MSKKIKFRGRVNGQECSSVEEYNKAMAKAIAAGGDIDASSETYTEDENDPADLFPGLEDLNCLDDIKNHIADFCIEDATNLFDGYKDLVADAIAGLSDKDREDYITNTNRIMNELGRIYNQAKETATTFERALADVEKHIKELNENKTILNCKLADVKELLDVANIFGKGYEELRDEAVKGRKQPKVFTERRPIKVIVDKPEPCNCGCAEHTAPKKDEPNLQDGCGCKPECQCRETRPQTEKIVSSFIDFLHNLGEIADEVFKK